MSSDLIKHVTDASFEADVLKAEGAVLVDYWAEWCGPCKMIAPVLDEIAETYKGKLTVAKLNIDEYHVRHAWRRPWCSRGMGQRL